MNSGAPSSPTVFLIPSFLDENAVHTIPPYVLESVKQCRAFFVENERSSRRFLKKMWKEMVIDDYRWFTIHKAEPEVIRDFEKMLSEGQNIGIISEAGCPGIADPGQFLVSAAHKMGAIVVPLVGPSSILLALMASGLNGQNFAFNGYLPVKPDERVATIRQLESESQKKNCTQIFIETPYRNNQLLESLLKTCSGDTRMCIAADLTSAKEWVKTKKIGEWKKEMPDLHKRLVIFLLLR